MCQKAIAPFVTPETRQPSGRPSGGEDAFGDQVRGRSTVDGVSSFAGVGASVHHRNRQGSIRGGHARRHRRSGESGADRERSARRSPTPTAAISSSIFGRAPTSSRSRCSGFNTVKRDGVTVSGSGIVTVDAEMRVGSLEETITVTGEAPIVDVRSSTQQRVLNSEVIDALPSARNYFGLARMMPNTMGGGNDVGGSLIQDVGQSVTVHGSRNVDQRVTVNGVNTMTLQAGGNIGGQTPDVGSAAEVTVDTNSLSADLPTGGVRINFVPKDGGNRFSNSTFLNFTNESLQGDNFSDELRAAGLSTPNRIVNALRHQRVARRPVQEGQGVVLVLDALQHRRERGRRSSRTGTPTTRTSGCTCPTRRNPGVNKGYQFNSSLRVTWQATPRNKIAGTYKADKWCNCPNNISATVAPEAGRDRRFPRLRQEHAEWTSPVTNKLLFEAVGLHLYERWGNMHHRVNGGSLEDRALEAILPQMISVLEQSNNLIYRSQANYNNTAVPSWTYRAAMSYVTGSHAVKFGFNRTHGYLDEYNYTLNPVSYRFNKGVPNQITERAFPFRANTNLDNDLGFYAQDRWTLDRWTHPGRAAVRLLRHQLPRAERRTGGADPDTQHHLPGAGQHLVEGPDLPKRRWPTTCSATARPREGGVQQVPARSDAQRPRPQSESGARDGDHRESHVERPRRSRHQRRLRSAVRPAQPAGQRRVRSRSRLPRSARRRRATLYDKDLITGFNHRQANWEFSTSVQREIMPRVVARRRLLPPRVGPFPGDRQSAAGAGGLHAVRRRRADRLAAAGRRRLHPHRLLRRRPDEVRAGQPT